MKKLKDYQELKNAKLVKEYSDSVKLVNLYGENYILKEMKVPLSRKELLNQHTYIQYLIDNGINVSKILGYYEENNIFYEVQEFITGDFLIKTEDLIKLLSKFHCVSKKYANNLEKRYVFEVQYKCRGAKLNYLLLGFEEKYYKYPLDNLKRSFIYVSSNNLDTVNKLVKLFNKSYNMFVNKYDINSTIIHNDVNSTNIINNLGQLYLIDFDLCIKSSEYVDFVDACMKRYDSIDYIEKKFNDFITNINKNILIYNKYNSNLILQHEGVYLMCIIKLFAFYFYVMLRKENFNIFNENLNVVYRICYYLYNLVGGS
ncbi:MAG TPA: phosphotransferase [Candidatus Onthousia faecavium]|nr:phosphotransferase [Candidatus Onthousia faecavium]